MNFGGQEMVVVLVIVLILFGGKKIPELMRGVGKGVGELQRGIEESKRTLNASLHEHETPSHTYSSAGVEPQKESVAAVHEIKPKPAENTVAHSEQAPPINEAS